MRTILKIITTNIHFYETEFAIKDSVDERAALKMLQKFMSKIRSTGLFLGFAQVPPTEGGISGKFF